MFKRGKPNARALAPGPCHSPSWRGHPHSCCSHGCSRARHQGKHWQQLAPASAPWGFCPGGEKKTALLETEEKNPTRKESGGDCQGTSAEAMGRQQLSHTSCFQRGSWTANFQTSAERKAKSVFIAFNNLWCDSEHANCSRVQVPAGWIFPPHCQFAVWPWKSCSSLRVAVPAEHHWSGEWFPTCRLTSASDVFSTRQ